MLNRIPRVLVVFLLAAPAVLAQAPPPTLAAPKDPVAAATRFIDLLVKGDYPAAAALEGGVMKKAAPAAKLSEIWTGIQTQLGAYKRRVATRSEKPAQYDVVFVTTAFEKQTVDLKVVIDDASEVVGFFIQPVQSAAPPPDPSPPPYAKPDSYHEREVTVGSGEWALPGTLTMPVGAGPFPAVVLVHGSGPNDRDETVESNKPFRDLALGLASRGIAVLRYEKRTRQYAGKVADVAGFTVQQETVTDALTALALLRGSEGVDPRRVFVLGHSLGGMLLPRIGQSQPALAGLIVMAGAARPMEDLILEQVSYLAALDGIVTDPEKKQIEGLRAEVAKVKGLKPGATESALGAPASYWLDLQGYDPPQAAKYLPQPMLILQGERDYQVTMADFTAWKKGLAGKPNVTFKSYPKLDHLFLAGEGKSGPAEYEKPGHVDAGVVGDIAAWILGQGKKPAERTW
ncbi:MAG TPA: alpha/beta fold hydrolase [Thermoanaerobaculia bacterium]|nr:alpha/beta fold hydrolase [Thermoanaerobaculia bacterium]